LNDSGRDVIDLISLRVATVHVAPAPPFEKTPLRLDVHLFLLS
jgi:hypothetical protein